MTKIYKNKNKDIIKEIMKKEKFNITFQTFTEIFYLKIKRKTGVCAKGVKKKYVWEKGIQKK